LVSGILQSIIGGVLVCIGSALIESFRWFRYRKAEKRKVREMATKLLAEVEFLSQGIDSFIELVRERLKQGEKEGPIPTLSEPIIDISLYESLTKDLGKLNLEAIISIKKFYNYIIQAKNLINIERVMAQEANKFVQDLFSLLTDALIKRNSGTMDYLSKTRDSYIKKVKEDCMKHLKDASSSFIQAKKESEKAKEELRKIINA
jgi:hypothetical protein